MLCFIQSQLVYIIVEWAIGVAFKKLRTDGHIERLYKTSTKYYDLIFSQ